MNNPGIIEKKAGGNQRTPPDLLKRVRLGGETFRLKKLLDSLGVKTVCEAASCPNISECFEAGEVTFMILGSVCTRNCGFCGIRSGKPGAPDPAEPGKVATAALRLNLKYVVLTSVTRDDLDDFGAEHFAAGIKALREKLPGVLIEVLIPDFRGSGTALRTVLEQKPAVLGHNMETVKRLYPSVRSGSDYERSLEVLRTAAARSPEVLIKSGLMVGLGEEDDEIRELMEDIRCAGVSMITVGHYLPPAVNSSPLAGFQPPEKFQKYRKWARALGFECVSSGTFVRSSYRAFSQLKEAKFKIQSKNQLNRTNDSHSVKEQ